MGSQQAQRHRAPGRSPWLSRTRIFQETQNFFALLTTEIYSNSRSYLLGSNRPRTLTRLVRAVGAYLKTFGINIFLYLDDWLVVGETHQLALSYRDTVRMITQRVGFLINEEKSDWTPSQFPMFLGSVLDLVLIMMAYPSEDRIDHLRLLILRIMKSLASMARLWKSLFSHLASMIQLDPKGSTPHPSTPVFYTGSLGSLNAGLTPSDSQLRGPGGAPLVAPYTQPHVPGSFLGPGPRPRVDSCRQFGSHWNIFSPRWAAQQ